MRDGNKNGLLAAEGESLRNMIANIQEKIAQEVVWPLMNSRIIPNGKNINDLKKRKHNGHKNYSKIFNFDNYELIYQTLNSLQTQEKRAMTRHVVSSLDLRKIS